MSFSPAQSSLRDSSDSLVGMQRAPSVMSDTSGFEVRYNLADSHDGALPAMSPLPTRKATEQFERANSSSSFVARELDATASPSASPLPTQLAPHHPDHPQQQQQQQQQQAFSFAAAHHSVSPPASSASPTYSDHSLDEAPHSMQLSSTVRFTPTPSAASTPAATPSSSASPPLLAHSDSPAAARLPSQHHEQASSRSQQQQRSASRPVPPALHHDADPFQQLSDERTLLMGSSVDMSSRSAARSREHDATLAKTMMSPAAAALASQRAQQQRDGNSYQFQEAEEKQQLTQTVPRTPAISTAPAAVPLTSTDTLAASQLLSTLSASALAQKARKIESLIAEFDRKFLDASSSAASGAGPTYPAWALPFVEEMATKLELVLAAQHRAEESEAAAAGLGRSVRFNQRDTARRAAEREQARRRVDHIAALKHGRQSQSLPSSHFYPEDQYTVGLNDDLPFLRDHGAFAQRRAAPLTALASPRRNLGIDASTPRDPTLPYQTEARERKVAAVMSSTAPAFSPVPAERPQSARASSRRSSERYLTGLLGHDVGASTLNGLFRSTVRSPSPPGRLQTQAYPGPTIPKAPRFAPVRPLSPPAGLRRKKEGGMTAEQRRRERERELEMHALRIRCEELQDALEAERRAQEDAATSAPGSPLRLASPRPVAASSTLDEDALASALLRVGLANREKFLALMSQIQSMQASMASQTERFNAALESGALARPASMTAAESEAATERHRKQQLELDRLNSELASTLAEKDRLAAQVRNLASLSEKHKFALMEKQSLLSMSGSDARAKAQQDSLLLRTYEQDLRAAREAITQLQGMVSREHSHATAFKSEASSLQARLDKLQALLGDSAAKSAALSYAAGRASLKPAEKLKHLMHKYMAGFYRAEYQKLLAERSKSSSHAEAVEMELSRTKEKHALELEYTRESHRAVLEHVTGSLHQNSDHRTALQVQLDEAQQELAVLEDQKAEQERELIATERLNAQLQSQLATGSKDASAAASSLGLDSDFGALMAASFKGDYLTLRNDTRMLKTVYGLGDEHILFSDFAQRIDRYRHQRKYTTRGERGKRGCSDSIKWLVCARSSSMLCSSVLLRAVSVCSFCSRNKYQQRILLLTNRHLLCFWADRGRPLRRTIPILDIQYISLSRQAANVFVLHVKDAYDYLLLSSKRAEIMYHLLTLTQKLSGGTRTLQYRFGERIYVADRNKTHREVQVAESGITLGQASHRHANNPEEERFIQMAGEGAR